MGVPPVRAMWTEEIVVFEMISVQNHSHGRDARVTARPARYSMDHKSVLDRLDMERRTLVRDGEVIEILPTVTRLIRCNGTWHTIMFSSVSPGTIDQVIDEQLAHYQKLNAEFEWKVYAHDPPPDLRQRLGARGFDIGPAKAVMVLDLTHPPSWINEPAMHPVQRIQSVQHFDLFRSAREEIFGKNFQMPTNELAEALRTRSTHHQGYIATDNASAVSIGRLYTHPDSHFGGLYGGGTRASHRSRGYYRAILAARARDAITMNLRYLIVDALPTSRPILERLDFIRLTETWHCTWRPTSDSPLAH
jgi:hypothetical protein